MMANKVRFIKRNSFCVISLDFDDGLDMQLLILFFLLLNNKLFTVSGQNEWILIYIALFDIFKQPVIN